MARLARAFPLRVHQYQNNTIAPTDADTGTIADAGESVAVAVTAADTGSLIDAGEALSPPGVPFPAALDNFIGTDGGESITVTTADGDTGTGGDTDNVFNPTDDHNDADTGSSAEDVVSIGLDDTELGTGTDAGEAVSAPTADADIGSWDDSGASVEDPAIIQKVVGTASTGLTYTLSLPVAPTVGNLLILAVCCGNNTTNPGARTVPTGWTSAADIQRSTTGQSVTICYRVVQAGDGVGVTFTTANSVTSQGVLWEYFGMATTAVVDQVITTDGGASVKTSQTSGTTATTTLSSEIAIAAWGLGGNSGGSESVTNGFAIEDPGSNQIVTADKTLSAVGTVESTAAWAPTTPFIPALNGSAAWNTTATSKPSTAVTWLAGDMIVVMAGASGSNAESWNNVPTATGLTFTQRAVHNSTGTDCSASVWTAIAAANGSQIITVTPSAIGNSHWGFQVWTFRGAAVGTATVTATPSTTKTVSFTPTVANSSVMWGVFDWNASSPLEQLTPAPSQNHRTQNDPSEYDIYIGRKEPAVATNYGVNGVQTGKYTIVAMEAAAVGQTAVAALVTFKASGATTINVNDTETGSGADAGEAIALADADTGTGADTNGTIALADTDVGSGGDADAAPNQLVNDTETGTGLEQESIALALTDTDTGSGADAGEAVTTTITDSDTGSGTDAGESATVALNDTETGTGTDAGETLGISDTESGTGADTDVSVVQGASDSESIASAEAESIAVTLSDADTGAGADLEAIALSDADTGSGTDAGETVAIGITDSDTGTGDDANVAPVIALSTTETGTGTDAGESVAVALTDADTATGADAGEALAVTLSDDDPATGADGGENNGQTQFLADNDTALGADAGESLAVTLSTTETGTGADAGESLAITDTDTGTGVDGGETIPTASNPSDAEIAAFLEIEAIAVTLSDSDTGSGVDAGTFTTSLPSANLPGYVAPSTLAGTTSPTMRWGETDPDELAGVT